jgi:adenylate cyclase
MSDNSVTKRLSAILAADVAGYTRLMEEDSDGTVAAWQTARSNVIDPSIAEHTGRIVKHTGDGFLAEFSTVQSAVECAVAMQDGLTSSSLEFRMGINLGDIIDDGEDIHGEGVNIAARIEALAEAGGISISGSAFEQVRNRLNCQFEDTGEHNVKHVSAPVRVYRIVRSDIPVAALVSSELPLPDKPSIAVLPFENMSGDPEQEYLADGMAEDLLTSLSQIHELFVIARNSSFSYKGQNPDIRKVSKDLGARYILEGSVRKAGTRVRITSQLIDGTNGMHVWAERYDRELGDIFELQDDITSNIATALQIELTEGKQLKFRRSQTKSLPGWQVFQQAQYHLRRFSRGDNMIARDLLQTALQHDPKFVSAMSLLAWTYLVETRLPWGSSTDDAIASGLALVDRATKLTGENPDVLSMLGLFRLAQEEYDLSEEANRRAVDLGPNIADIHVGYALLLNMRNRPEEAIAMLENAKRLCPIYPDWYLGILGISYRLLKRYDDAIEADQRRLKMNPNNAFSDIRLAAVYVEIGDIDQARHHVKEALKKQPNYRVSNLSETDRYEDPELMRQYENLLRKAGLPEA